MKLKEVAIKNFRLLENSRLDLDNELTWVVGKNNTGKTSFLVLLDYFFNSNNYKLSYNDFSRKIRKDILSIDDNTDVYKYGIKLLMTIEYDIEDNLKNISEFINDLSIDKNIVKIGFEAIIKKDKLLKSITGLEDKNKKEYIKKNLSEYIETKLYVYNEESDFESNNRSNLIEKEAKLLRKVINYQLVNAKRDVSSSEEQNSKKVLSNIITKYYNSMNDADEVKKINNEIMDLDRSLDKKYESFFDDFLNTTRKFMQSNELRIESDLESKFLMSNMSKVVYGASDDSLPEYLNGLGYMNLLYLLLNIEVCKTNFQKEQSDINILCIEEPEAHTHPQLQYIFAREIKNIILGIDNVQSIITTHSSHIVSQSDFSALRYFKYNNKNIEIYNFEKEMKELYKDNKDYYSFLTKYLSIQSSELFFSDKVIFIEGISERILINYFMKQHDNNIEEKIRIAREQVQKKGREISTEILSLQDQLLLNQNISILEAGANAKIFEPFLNFLKIKVLIITDIDSVKLVNKNGKNRWHSCSVDDGEFSSNATIKNFIPVENVEEKKKWFDKLKKCNGLVSNNIMLSFQHKVGDYHARTFEDAFIYENIDNLLKVKSNIEYLEIKDFQKDDFNLKGNDFYNLIFDNGIFDCDNKSNFASEIYLISSSSEKNIEWIVPQYIREGLEWLSK